MGLETPAISWPLHHVLRGRAFSASVDASSNRPFALLVFPRVNEIETDEPISDDA